jgi:hypothetical protein
MIAFLTDQLSTRKSLEHLGLSTQPQDKPPPVRDVLRVTEQGRVGEYRRTGSNSTALQPRSRAYCSRLAPAPRWLGRLARSSTPPRYATKGKTGSAQARRVMSPCHPQVAAPSHKRRRSNRLSVIGPAVGRHVHLKASV